MHLMRITMVSSGSMSFKSNSLDDQVIYGEGLFAFDSSPARWRSAGRQRAGEWDSKIAEGVYATCAALHEHGGRGALAKIKLCIPTYDPRAALG